MPDSANTDSVPQDAKGMTRTRSQDRVAGPITDVPFAYRRRVRWGDCDPEGMIYTPRVYDYLLEALEAWYLDVLGLDFADLKYDRHMAMPTVRMECNFLKALKPGMEPNLHVFVERLGNASLSFIVDAVDDDGAHYLRFNHTGCFIDLDGFKPTRPPEDFIENITAYQAACGQEPPQN